MTRRRSAANRPRRPASHQQQPKRLWRWWPAGALLLAAGAVAVALFASNSAGGPAPWSRLGTSDVHSLSFVGDDLNHLLFGHHGGVSESRDGGRTWRPLATAVDAMGMTPAADGSIVVAGHEVFTASSDGGATWQPITANLPSLDIHGFTRDPSDPDRMWAYLATGGLWESTDGGDQWTQVREDNVVFPLATARGGVTWLLGVDATGLVASDDGGRTWAMVGTPPTYPMTALAATPDGGTVYAASPEGLFRSTDGGATWRKTAFSGAPFAIATSSDGTTVALVDQSTEFFRSADGGGTWPRAGS